jgi:hypothetical protein
MKRIVAWILLVLMVPQTVMAGELIRAGTTYVAKEDMRIFTIPEARKLLQSLAELDACKEQIAQYEANEKTRAELSANQQQQIKNCEGINRIHAEANERMKEAFDVLRTAVQESKDAKSLYKDIIEVQNKTIKQQAEELGRKDRRNRWQRTASFVFGLLSPIAGAWGLGRIGNFIKF